MGPIYYLLLGQAPCEPEPYYIGGASTSYCTAHDGGTFVDVPSAAAAAATGRTLLFDLEEHG